MWQVAGRSSRGLHRARETTCVSCDSALVRSHIKTSRQGIYPRLVRDLPEPRRNSFGERG